MLLTVLSLNYPIVQPFTQNGYWRLPCRAIRCHAWAYGLVALYCALLILPFMNNLQLDITWDPVKAQSNITKHGVTFVQASTVLQDALALTVFDAAHSEFEERWFTLGMSADGKLLAVSHTYQHTGPVQAKARIISAREATRRERQQYESEPR
jgi:uncharacterized protein